MYIEQVILFLSMWSQSQVFLKPLHYCVYLLSKKAANIVSQQYDEVVLKTSLDLFSGNSEDALTMD